MSLLLGPACTSGDPAEDDAPSRDTAAAPSQAPSGALEGPEESEGSDGCTSRGAGAADANGAEPVEEGDFDGDKTTGEYASPQDDEQIRVLSDATCYDDPLDNAYV